MPSTQVALRKEKHTNVPIKYFPWLIISCDVSVSNDFSQYSVVLLYKYNVWKFRVLTCYVQFLYQNSYIFFKSEFSSCLHSHFECEMSTWTGTGPRCILSSTLMSFSLLFLRSAHAHTEKRILVIQKYFTGAAVKGSAVLQSQFLLPEVRWDDCLSQNCVCLSAKMGCTWMLKSWHPKKLGLLRSGSFAPRQEKMTPCVHLSGQLSRCPGQLWSFHLQ